MTVQVLPHTGPTNLRLRAQVGLVVPPGEGARFRVADAGWRPWTQGASFVFDESCEHEVMLIVVFCGGAGGTAGTHTATALGWFG